MTIDANNYFDIKEDFPNLDSEIRGILMARAQNGATIQEIREDFYNLTGEKFPIYDDVTDFLLTIPYVTAMCNENGTRIFNILPSEKTRHVYDMVVAQKPPPYRPPSYQSSFGKNINPYNNNNNINHNNHFCTNRPSSVRTRSEKNSSRSESEGFYDNINCFFEDNYQYLFNRFHREEIPNNLNANNLNINNNQQFPPVNSFTNNLNSNNDDGVFKKPLPKPRIYTSSSRGATSPTTTKSLHDQDWGLINDWTQDAHLFDFQLLGDDFMLYLARMELKCKFKPGEKVLQSGLCISGQTISAATKRLSQLNYVNKRMIINIGSVDILQGKPLVEIQHDFLDLLSVLRERGVMPVVTTLAPLALFAHEKSIKNRLERFNVFIKQRAPKVIDIWSCVVNEKGQTLFDCFQDKPRNVTGSHESYLFWNKIGRQRVLKKIESEIEY